MLGSIGFKQLRVRCIIGIEDHEKEKEQDLFIDVKVEFDLSVVSVSRLLEDTVDYVDLAKLTERIAQEGRYELVENYAIDLARAVLNKYPVLSVTLLIRKPQALDQAECSFIEPHVKRTELL